jgi:hypothetical protein
MGFANQIHWASCVPAQTMVASRSGQSNHANLYAQKIGNKFQVIKAARGSFSMFLTPNVSDCHPGSAIFRRDFGQIRGRRISFPGRPCSGSRQTRISLRVEDVEFGHDER